LNWINVGADAKFFCNCSALALEMPGWKPGEPAGKMPALRRRHNKVVNSYIFLFRNTT